MKDFSRTHYAYPKTQDWKHNKNNEWFKETLERLSKSGVPLLKIDNIPFGLKFFNLKGEEVNRDGTPAEKYSFVFSNTLTGEWGGAK